MRDLIAIGLLSNLVKQFREHNHFVWEIVYYTHGTGITKVDNRDFLFQPKTILCLPPSIPHSEYSESGYRNYHFSVRSFYFPEHTVLQFQDNDSEDFFTIMNHMYKEFHKKQNNWQSITESLLSILYQYMIAWLPEIETNPLIEKFENNLLSNISNPYFNIEKEIAMIPFSKDHFRKIFKIKTGKTPLQYLTEKRMTHAMKLMEANTFGTLKINEIARFAGFNDPYYFSRIFKRYTGKSPSDWIQL